MLVSEGIMNKNNFYFLPQSKIEFAFLSLTYLFTSMATDLHLRRTDVAEGVLLPYAQNLANWFSGKSLKLLPPDVRL